MGKKHDKKKKTKVVLSLAEFNEDAGIGGVDPELSALPSAPKAAEEWEAQGGRPEYNSRGYKERTPRGYDADADFDDRDWARKGPLDAPDGSAFGMGGPDRDWGDMRRGPMDGPDAAPERDWNDMRRGPVDSAFSGPVVERDWGARKGPVEAELGSAPRVIDDENWGAARKNTVEAEFPGAPAADRDWTVRKGPVDADLPAAPAQEADWSAPRKGPVESEFAAAEADIAERDWTKRKGPIEAEPAPGKQTEADWSDVRKGPVEAEVPAPKPDVAERDWSARRGPVETEVESAQKAVRDIDFGEMRRGAKLEELKEAENIKAKEAKAREAKAKEGEAAHARRPEVEKERWRRDSAGVVGRRGSAEARASERPASTGHDAAPPKDRDWGAARRTQPLRANPRQHRPSGGRNSDVSEASSDVTQADATDSATKNNDDDDWTTVRGASQRRSGPAAHRRFSEKDNRGGFQRRGGPHQGMQDSKGEKPKRSPLSAESKTTTSPITPVPSAVSES